MTEKAVVTKAEALPDLDDLLQCPVCYEIPAGQIFQCNEGHHVCGRCKLRLDVCPVCRAFFFGTRNYAMEELIANIRKLRAFKLGGKVTTGDTTPEQQNIEAKESTSEENESTNNDEDDGSSVHSANNRTLLEPPRPCSGLFRCLCCKINPERLPSARLLNHLRYFHSPELIEGRSDDNGEYLQAWQFSTDEGRITTAVRVADMGLFFLVIEITHDTVFAWLVMASSPRVAEEFSYTFTLSGNDREAIFSDCVWSVRTCEGFLKKRMRCLSVSGPDARALLAPTTMSAKLSVRRTPLDVVPHQAQPRAVLRVANRSNRSDATGEAVSQELEPFLQDLQNDVARLSRAFATLGREANALVRSEAEMRARLEITHNRPTPTSPPRDPPSAPLEPAPRPQLETQPETESLGVSLSRNARRRMRQRLRQALRENQMTDDIPSTPSAPTARSSPSIQQGANANRTQTDNSARQTNGQITNLIQNNNSRVQNAQTTPASTGRANNQNTNRNTPRTQNNEGDYANNNQQREDSGRANTRAHSPIHAVFSGFAVVVEPPVAPPPVPPPAGSASTGNNGRNKKKRRQRR